MDDLAYLNSVISSQNASRPRSTEARSLDDTTRSLSTLLSSLQTSANSDEELDDRAVAALLNKLETADGAADALENRVDSLLSSLDSMLEGLQEAAPVTAASAVDGVGAEAPIEVLDEPREGDERIASEEKPAPG